MTWNKGWDEIFKKFNWGLYPNEELVRFLKSDLKNNKNIKPYLLEIGCGIGANFFLYHKEGLNSYGIDGSAVAIEKAKKLIKKEKYKVNLKIGDIVTLPYKSDYFDYVIDIECLYSNDEKSTIRILNEVFRVLKPNGKFFSITFGTNTDGYKKGLKIKGERNTFIKGESNVLKKEYELIRYSNKKDIKKIYSKFFISNVNKIIRTKNNGNNIIEEWIIECQKKI